MFDLMDPSTIDDMIGMTPGAVVVSCGGVTGWGHFAHVPTGFGDDVGAVVSEPSVVIASSYFAGVCLDDGAGTTEGVGERITVGDYDWYVRAIEPGESPGEIRVLLSNRETSGG